MSKNNIDDQNILQLTVYLQFYLLADHKNCEKCFKRHYIWLGRAACGHFNCLDLKGFRSGYKKSHFNCFYWDTQSKQNGVGTKRYFSKENHEIFIFFNFPFTHSWKASQQVIFCECLFFGMDNKISNSNLCPCGNDLWIEWRWNRAVKFQFYIEISTLIRLLYLHGWINFDVLISAK
jgi:hypothetical protein